MNLQVFKQIFIGLNMIKLPRFLVKKELMAPTNSKLNAMFTYTLLKKKVYLRLSDFIFLFEIIIAYFMIFRIV